MLRRRVIGSINISNVAIVTCESKTYNGQTQVATNITVAFKGEILTEGVDYIVTENNGGTNVGLYTVKIKGIKKYSGNEQGSFSIMKVTPTVTVPTPRTSLVYNGSNQALIAAGSTDWGTLKYSLDDSTYSTSIPSGTNATSYTVYYKVEGDSNVNDVPAQSVSVSIGKVTPTVVAPTAKVLTYNGSQQELVNAGSTNFGTLQYRAGSDSWSTSIPTRQKGGSYVVQYKVVGDSNINDVAAESVQCSINEKQVTATVTLSQTAYTYNGSACQPTPTVKDGSTVIDPSEYSVTYSNNINAGTGTVTISDNAGGDYEVIGSATFAINQAACCSTAPSATTYSYNGSVRNLVSGGSSSCGTMQYATVTTATYSTTIPTQTNAGTYTTYWKVSNDSNHSGTCSGSVSTTISKVAGSVTTAPVNNNYTYNGTARAVASAGNGTGTMYYRLGTSGNFSTTMPTMTNASSNTLYYYAAESTNYTQSSTGSITVSVQKANISPTVSISNWTYGGPASNPSVAGNSGSGTVTYYYKLSSASSWSTTKPSAAGSYNIRADIAATTNYNSGTCTSNFTINKANSSLSFSITNIVVEKGQTKTNVVTVNKGDGTVTYSSDNTTAVTVNNSGVITGVEYGSALITATISEGTNYKTASNNYTANCTTFIITKHNITSTSNPTLIAGNLSGFSSIEIDGVVQPSVVSAYTFSTTGEHTIKYALKDPTVVGEIAFGGCTSIRSAIIPDSVTSLGNNVFNGCRSLTSVTLSNNITAISIGTFRYCESLSSVNIPSGVTSIGNYAFSYCSGLTRVDIPDSVRTINTAAFWHCEGLTAVTIGTGIVSIGESGFSDTTNIEYFRIDAPSPPSLGKRAFGGHSSQCPIYVPTCQLVNSYQGVWTEYGTSLRIISLDCPILIGKYYVTDTTNPTQLYTTGDSSSALTILEVDGVTPATRRPNYTFQTTGVHTVKFTLRGTILKGSLFIVCNALTDITIGSGVTEFKDYIFDRCSNLSSITMLDTTAPAIRYNTFYNVKTGGTLRVPRGSTGYDAWMGTGDYYLGKYNWTKVEQ